MYPSTYGEPFVSCEDRVTRYIEQNGRTRQDRMLTDLSAGIDSYRSNYLHAAQRLIERGELSMEWDRIGYPYYVPQGVS